MTLTADRVRTVFDYDPETGIVRWKKHKTMTGKIAGTQKQSGHIQVGLDGKLYAMHRIIYLYVEGGFPDGSIDHINHNPADNRWANLRVVSHSDNMKNKRKYKSNKTGTTGVFYHAGQNRWHANIRTNSKSKHLGSYISKDDAIAARSEAEPQHDFHENHGS